MDMDQCKAPDTGRPLSTLVHGEGHREAINPFAIADLRLLISLSYDAFIYTSREGELLVSCPWRSKLCSC